MDKSWISADRDTLEYEVGVEKFLMYAEQNCKDPKKIPCPCAHVNFKKFSVKIIRGNLYEKGFSLGYTNWIWHGEKTTRGDIKLSASASYSQEHIPDVESEMPNVCEAAYEDLDKETYKFKRFVEDAEQPLYKGSDSTKLDSMLKLHNWKARFGVSDSAFTYLLSSVGSLLPKDHVSPVILTKQRKPYLTWASTIQKSMFAPNECILDAFENASRKGRVVNRGLTFRSKLCGISQSFPDLNDCLNRLPSRN